MKAINIIYLILIVLTGCQKFEEFKENETAYFNSEEKIAEAITGAYSNFKNIFLNRIPGEYTNEFSWYPMPNSKGDDFNHSTINDGYYELVDGKLVYQCLDESSFWPVHLYGENSESWYDFYKTITTLNSIIVHAEKQNGLNAGVKKILGEAYLLRGYTYFRLVRVYGEVPLIRDITVSYTVTKSSFEEIYNSIEQDLKTAINLLPVNGAEARIPNVTPHAGTAKAILAEVYLTRAGYPLKQTDYYTKAAEICGNIIDSASFYGFEIIPNFANLWKNANNWNSETVLAMSYNEGPFDIWTELRLYREDSNQVGSVMLTMSGPNYGTGINFYNNYPKSYRKSVTFYSLRVKPYSLNNIRSDTVVSVETDSMDLCTPIYYNKFNEVWYLDSTVVFDANSMPDFWRITEGRDEFNLLILRYAQTLLTYAEAKARSGKLDAMAYEAVNVIRRRAHKVDLYSPSKFDLTPGLSADQFADSVVWERAWELCAEPEGRWFDLMRLEMVEDLPSLRHVKDMMDYPEVIDKNYYFIPIPQAEIDFNPNLK